MPGMVYSQREVSSPGDHGNVHDRLARVISAIGIALLRFASSCWLTKLAWQTLGGLVLVFTLDIPRSAELNAIEHRNYNDTEDSWIKE